METIGQRTVFHFHFPGWPDKMAPKDCEPVLNFLTSINTERKRLKDTSPMIVHCRYAVNPFFTA